MGKKRKSLSLSEDNAEWLSEQDNASALVDRLVSEYRAGGGDVAAMVNFNLREVSAEVEYLQKKLEAKQDKLEYLDEKAEKSKPAWKETVEEAAEVFNGNDLAPAQVEHWAGKAGLDEATFREKYDEVRE